MNQDETMVMLKAKDLQGIQDELKAYKDLVRHLYDEIPVGEYYDRGLPTVSGKDVPLWA